MIKINKKVKTAGLILLVFIILVGGFFTLWGFFPPIGATTYKLSSVNDPAGTTFYAGSYVKLFEDNETFEIVIKQGGASFICAIGTYTQKNGVITFNKIAEHDTLGQLAGGANLNNNILTLRVGSFDLKLKS